MSSFGGNPDDLGHVVAMTFWGYIDIEDSTQPHPALRGKGERFGLWRKAMRELRSGVIAGCPVIRVEVMENCYEGAGEVPHMGHDATCADGCEGIPASRVFGLSVTVLGDLKPPAGTGVYVLADGKVQVNLTGASYVRIGTIDLEVLSE